MNFGEVLEAMKDNPKRRFARIGWNGKNMFIYYTPGHRVMAMEWTGPKECLVHKDTMQDDGTVITEHYAMVSGHIDMKSANNTVIIGWCASQTDMLQEDWVEVF